MLVGSCAVKEGMLIASHRKLGSEVREMALDRERIT